MFHLILTIVYLLPLTYAYFGIKRNFIPRNWRLPYTLVFILLVSLFPLNILVLEDKTGALADIIGLLGHYTMAFFLYLLLMVLLFDIFLLLNGLLHIISRPVLIDCRQKRKGLIVLVSLSLAIVGAGIINFNTIRATHYKIEVPKGSSQKDHLKIAFAADFHLHERTSLRFTERFVEKIQAIQPDLMLFGGDIVEGNGFHEKRNRFEKLIRQIKPRYGVYSVLGNHEFYAGVERATRFFQKAGIELLNDSVKIIDGSVILAGRYDQHKKDRMSLKKLLQPVRDTLPVIMLDHRPTRIEQVSRTKVDLQLSGHTHNGQLFPFNFITRNIYPISWGYEEINNTHFIVTSGIRLWGPPVRTAGKSEIVVVDLYFR